MRERTFGILIGLVMLCLILLFPVSLAARPDSTQITPSDDANVFQNLGSTNFGASTDLLVASNRDFFGGAYHYYNSRVYLKFSLDTIPNDALIKSATLNLNHRSYYKAATRTYDVHRVTTNWNEGTITWNNQPSYNPARTTYLTFNTSDINKWRAWNVTSDIDKTALENDWVSWCIKDNVEDSATWHKLILHSKERDGYDPYLEITYNSPPTLSGSASPSSGAWGTTFTYEVTYTDVDGDLPAMGYPKVYIDGRAENMVEKDATDNDVTDGKVYKYEWVTTKANIGNHGFYFYAEDPNTLSARDPVSGTYSDPTIIKNSTTLTCSADDDTPTPGQMVTFDGYLKDLNLTGVSGKTITLFKDLSSTGLTDTTDANGYYSIPIVTPSALGTPHYYTSFAEGALYLSSQSSSIPVTTALPNQPPTLSNGSVSPASGTAGMDFVFEITYVDADGDAPAYVTVYMDNTEHTMGLVSGGYTTGALYRYTWSTTSADVGSYSHYFEASDGIDTARLPATDNYLGPEIIPTYKVFGWVKSEGVAIAGAQVTLDGQSTTTDENGYYEFVRLEGNKSYNITVSAVGYETYAGTTSVGAADTQSDISLPKVPTRIGIVPIPIAIAIACGVISGIVVFIKKKPRK